MSTNLLLLPTPLYNLLAIFKAIFLLHMQRFFYETTYHQLFPNFVNLWTDSMWLICLQHPNLVVLPEQHSYGTCFHSLKTWIETSGIEQSFKIGAVLRIKLQRLCVEPRNMFSTQSPSNMEMAIRGQQRPELWRMSIQKTGNLNRASIPKLWMRTVRFFQLQGRVVKSFGNKNKYYLMHCSCT